MGKGTLFTKCAKEDGPFLLSGKLDVLSSWDLDHLSSGIWTTYPLRFGPLILWDPRPLGYGKQDMRFSGIQPLGSCCLRIEVQPF